MENKEMDSIAKVLEKQKIVRVLWELLMEKLGLTLENDINDVVRELKITWDDYKDAMEKISEIKKEQPPILKKKRGGVS